MSAEAAAGTDSPRSARRLRARPIDWARYMFDQGAMVREIVKRDHQLRYPEQGADALCRALLDVLCEY